MNVHIAPVEKAFAYPFALFKQVTPFQLLVIATLEVPLFALNENIGLTLGITDIGGSMVVHMYGAYFGLAVSRWYRTSRH